MNSQILPRYSIEFSEKKMGNRGKDSIWELRVLSTCSMNAQNLSLFFLKFTDQMENWGEDGIWELAVLATCD